MCQQREEPPTDRYELILSTPCCYSAAALRLAMFRLGPSFTYTLHVRPIDLLDAQCHVREWTEGELSYHFNVVADSSFGPWEWCLEANDRKVGSKGE
jgi:hypothetical protein